MLLQEVNIGPSMAMIVHEELLIRRPTPRRFWYLYKPHACISIVQRRKTRRGTRPKHERLALVVFDIAGRSRGVRSASTISGGVACLLFARKRCAGTFRRLPFAFRRGQSKVEFGRERVTDKALTSANFYGAWFNLEIQFHNAQLPIISTTSAFLLILSTLPQQQCVRN